MALTTLTTWLLEVSLALPSATMPSPTREYFNSSTTGGSAPNAWLQALRSYYDPLPPPQPSLLLQLLAKVATSKIAAKKGFRVGSVCPPPSIRKSINSGFVNDSWPDRVIRTRPVAASLVSWEPVSKGGKGENKRNSGRRNEQNKQRRAKENKQTAGRQREGKQLVRKE